MQHYGQRLIRGCRNSLVIVCSPQSFSRVVQSQYRSLCLRCSLVIVSLLLLVGCAAPVAPGAPSGDEVAAGGEAAAAGEAEKPLQFWTTGLAAETEKLVQEQVDQFSKETGIAIDYLPISPADFQAKLQAEAAAGTPPDLIGAWSYTMTQLGDGLVPLNDLSAANDLILDDFIQAARQTNSRQEILYAMPWHRARACSPHYTSLGILMEGLQPENAFRLIQFLTDTEQQVNNTLNSYNRAGGQPADAMLLPTRFSAYEREELNFSCPPAREVVYNTEQDYQNAREIVQSRLDRLQPILDQNSAELADLLNDQAQSFNVARVAPVVTYGEYTEPTFIEVKEELAGKIIAIAVPITINFSKENFQKALERGVIVGAIFGVNEPITVIVQEERFTIEPDTEYALKLWTTGNPNEAKLALVNTDGEVPVGVVNLIDLPTDVDQPDVTVEIGSCYFSYYAGGFWWSLQFETPWAANSAQWWYSAVGYQVTPVVCQ